MGDDTSHGPLNNRKSLIYVDEYHADVWQVFGISLQQTPEWGDLQSAGSEATVIIIQS